MWAYERSLRWEYQSLGGDPEVRREGGREEGREEGRMEKGEGRREEGEREGGLEREEGSVSRK